MKYSIFDNIFFSHVVRLSVASGKNEKCKKLNFYLVKTVRANVRTIVLFPPNLKSYHWRLLKSVQYDRFCDLPQGPGYCQIIYLKRHNKRAS